MSVSTLFDGVLVTEIDGRVASACDCGVASGWIATCVYRIGSLQDGGTSVKLRLPVSVSRGVYRVAQTAPRALRPRAGVVGRGADGRRVRG